MVLAGDVKREMDDRRIAMDTKHTPGPWKWHEQGDANEFCVLANDDRWVISFRQNGEFLLGEERANARLIAAAPKLLDDHQAIYNATCIDSDTVELIIFQFIAVDIDDIFPHGSG